MDVSGNIVANYTKILYFHLIVSILSRINVERALKKIFLKKSEYHYKQGT